MHVISVICSINCVGVVSKSAKCNADAHVHIVPAGNVLLNGLLRFRRQWRGTLSSLGSIYYSRPFFVLFQFSILYVYLLIFNWNRYQYASPCMAIEYFKQNVLMHASRKITSEGISFAVFIKWHRLMEGQSRTKNIYIFTIKKGGTASDIINMQRWKWMMWNDDNSISLFLVTF